MTAGSDATFIATDYSALMIIPQYIWSFNGGVILPNNSKYLGQSTWNLTILNAQESDAGTYKCQISVESLNSGEATGQLFVCELKMLIPASIIIIIISLILSIIKKLSGYLCITRYS